MFAVSTHTKKQAHGSRTVRLNTGMKGHHMPAINDTATTSNGQATGADELASFMRIAQADAAQHLGILGRIAMEGISVAELLMRIGLTRRYAFQVRS